MNRVHIKGYLDVDNGYTDGTGGSGPITVDKYSKSLYYIFVKSETADPKAKVLVFTGSGIFSPN
jgi:hypothetical protein